MIYARGLREHFSFTEMDPSGFEPEASCSFDESQKSEDFSSRMQGRRSSQLSYGPLHSSLMNILCWLLYFFVDYYAMFIFENKKGGDPAVGSPTATL